MHYFTYRSGMLHAEEVALDALAREVGTPFYCYSTATLERHYNVFSKAFAGRTRSFATRSRLTPISRSFARWRGLAPVPTWSRRADLSRWRLAFRQKRSSFGVGKTRAEMAFALGTGIFGFNVESEAELRALSEVASGRSASARIAFRINPDVDAKTHAKISTGKSEHKFGVSWKDARSLYALARRCPASTRRASTCTSAARSRIWSRSTTPSPCSRAGGGLKVGWAQISFVNSEWARTAFSLGPSGPLASD